MRSHQVYLTLFLGWGEVLFVLLLLLHVHVLLAQDEVLLEQFSFLHLKW